MKSRNLLTPDDSTILSQARLAPGQERIYVAFAEQTSISDSGYRQRGDSRAVGARTTATGREWIQVTRNGPHHHAKLNARRRDWRHVHHSPWFWVGVAMFLAAILTYVFSEDLSLRPRLHRSAQGVEGKSVVGLSSP